MTPDSCTSPEGRCLTCGDLAVVLTVAALHADGVATCEARDGARETPDAACEAQGETRERVNVSCETPVGARETPDAARERVDVSLIEPPRVGDRVLVHAGVALAHLGDWAPR